jgi:hypothetical protein
VPAQAPSHAGIELSRTYFTVNSANYLQAESISYLTLLLSAGRLSGFEPRRPRNLISLGSNKHSPRRYSLALALFRRCSIAASVTNGNSIGPDRTAFPSGSRRHNNVTKHQHRIKQAETNATGHAENKPYNTA